MKTFEQVMNESTKETVVGGIRTRTFDLGEIANKMDQARQQNYAENKNQIDALTAEHDKLKAERDEYADLVKQRNGLIAAFNGSIDAQQKALAKKLGLKSGWLTATGRLSEAKVFAAAKKQPNPQSFLKEVVDKYNNEYVPQSNAIVQNAKRPNITPEMENATSKVQQLQARMKDLRMQTDALLGMC